MTDPDRPTTPKRRKTEEPWDTRLTDAVKATAFTEFLCDEIGAALSARSSLMDDYGMLDLAHALYEQQPQHRKGPWPGSANLGSYIGAEKVDAARALMMNVIAKAEPLCVVEGRGQLGRQNAPVIEEFHEWVQQAEERLFMPLAKWIHQALVERMGVMETYEAIERIVTVEERDLLVKTDPENIVGAQAAVLLDEDGQPIPETGTDGKFIDAHPGEPQAKVKVRSVQYVHKGPRHRDISGRDFVWLPAHARQREDVFGYFKRCYLRQDQLLEQVALGIYDKAAVEKLGTTGSREQTAHEDRQSITVQHTGHTRTQQHELWEGQLFYDFDGKGPRWHLITVSVAESVILRIKDDTLNRRRFVPMVLFPRPGSIEGYSFLLDKLYSIMEEHAGVRNMAADRSNLAGNAPILKVIGGKWRPQLQPWGPRAVIDVTDPNELTQMKVADVPESVIVREQQALRAAERVSGAADIVSSGVQPEGATTATEIAASAGYSTSRLKEQAALAQEAVEEWYELRHAIWLRALEFNGGMEIGESAVQNLADKGHELDGDRITADMLKGTVRFKPRGSVESADPVRMQQRYQQRYGDLFVIMKSFPNVGQAYAASVDIAEAILQDWADVHKPRNRQAFMKPLAQLRAAPPMMGGGGPFGPGQMPPGQMPPGMLPPGSPAENPMNMAPPPEMLQ